MRLDYNGRIKLALAGFGATLVSSDARTRAFVRLHQLDEATLVHFSAVNAAIPKGAGLRLDVIIEGKTRALPHLEGEDQYLIRSKHACANEW